MLTPLKNNEFQVTTTNQFSYLPYQQNLLNCNKQHQQPFTRTNKLRQNFNKRGYKAHASARPKSVDFEVGISELLMSVIQWVLNYEAKFQ